MQTIKKSYFVYKFDELSEEAQDHAIEKLYDINVQYDWWLFDDTFYYFGQEDYGIEVNMREICFDLDRGSYVYFDTHDHGSKYDKPAIRIIDSKKFLKKAGFDLRKSKHLIDNISITTKHYGGGSGKNIINCYEATGDEEAKMQDCLDQFSEELLSMLRSEYEGATSREAIIDTINANEYDFTEDGELF